MFERQQCHAKSTQTPYDDPIALILIPSVLLMALDLNNLGLALVIDNERGQLASTDTPAVQTERELLQVQSSLPIMPVHNAHALMRFLLLLLMVPEFLPWCTVVLGAGYACLEVNGAHVHDVEGILLFERNVGNKAGVDDRKFAEVRYVSYT